MGMCLESLDMQTIYPIGLDRYGVCNVWKLDASH